jgi:hypothetical protein
MEKAVKVSVLKGHLIIPNLGLCKIRVTQTLSRLYQSTQLPQSPKNVKKSHNRQLR